MSAEPPPSLPPEIAALLDAERAREPVPTEEIASAWQRMSSTLSGGPDGGGSSQGSNDSPANNGAANNDAASSGPMNEAAVDVARGVGATSAFGLKTTIASLVLGAAIGFGVGRSGDAEVRDPSPPPKSIATPAPESPTSAPFKDTKSAEGGSRGKTVQMDDLPDAGPTVATPPAVAAPVPTVLSAPAASSAPTTSPTTSTLKDERLLLERARAALVREDPTGALAALAEHETRFAEGQLAAERQALKKQAEAMQAELAP